MSCNNESRSHENHKYEIAACEKCNHGSGTGVVPKKKIIDCELKKDSIKCSSE